MFGVIEFYKQCTAAGIKPIIGMEAYVAPKTIADKTMRHAFKAVGKIRHRNHFELAFHSMRRARLSDDNAILSCGWR